jgi:hypothetical protein
MTIRRSLTAYSLRLPRTERDSRARGGRSRHGYLFGLLGAVLLVMEQLLRLLVAVVYV